MKTSKGKKQSTTKSVISNIVVPNEQIYKVHILDETGNASAVIIFSRGVEVEVDIANNDNVIFSEQQIHLDDSVRTIKQKILLEMIHQKTRFAKHTYEEMYLFGKPADVSNKTQYVRIGNKLGNNARISEYAEFDESPDIATSTDIINPYLLRLNAPLSKPPSQYVFENSLLLNYEPIQNNELYVCFAENVLEFARAQMPETEIYDNNARYIIQSYFPLLNALRIFSLDALREQKPSLLKHTIKMIDETKRTRDSVQLFYDVYNLTERNTNYTQKGIQHLRFSISPEISNQVHLPLELIFKRIHSSRNIPFIKYNPGSRRENLYRLYYDKIAVDGRKIPLLTQKQILKLSRDVGKSNQISVVVNAEKGTPVFYLHFEENGNITISRTYDTPVSISKWEEDIDVWLNPVLDELNREFRQTGYVIPLFQKLDAPNIRILNIKYVASTPITLNVRIADIQCIYSILNVKSERSTSDEPDIRYTRVENYTEMDAETAFITELYNESKHTGISADEIIEIMAHRFGKTEEYARARFIEFFKSGGEMTRSTVDHPGFPMKIQIANFQPILEFEIDRIDSIRYIEPLNVYIESIVKMTQEITPKSELGNYVRTACAGPSTPAQKQQIANVITTGVSKVSTEVVAPAARKNIQPFMLADDDDTDIFAELGLVAPQVLPEETAILPESVSLLDDEEDMSETDVNALLEELYKNTGKSEPTKEPVAVSPPLSPENIVEEDNPEPLAQDIPEKITASASDVDSESDDDSTPQGILPFNDSEDESPEGGAPRKKKRSVVEETNIAGPTTGVQDNATLRQNALLDGKPLSQPNPFLTKLQTLEPNLFLTKSRGKKFKTYSSACQPTSRHPIILTDEEKRRIDREHPGSYKNAIKYGTDPENPYWYICPRYWCFLTNSSISEEDVRANKCGSIIPQDATEIPPGAYVYEFKGEDHVDANGNYIQHHPGFLREGKHPDGYCLPCCFKNWDKGHQKERREQCDLNKEGVETPTQPAEVAEPTAAEGAEKRERRRRPKDTGISRAPQSEIYVISLDTYPVPETRWGFLPIPAQLFLNIDYKPVVQPNNPALIRENTATLLRYGVENVPNQSFLGVFADIYAYLQNSTEQFTVDEFREILAREITLDIFVKSHNSSLISSFSSVSKSHSRKRSQKDTPYQIQDFLQTDFAKRLNMTNLQEKRFFESTLSAYHNFLAYIKDPTEPIDHTYLWDIFTSDIAGLNKGGVNLILLEIAENDITDKIQYVCPTNRYSRNIYDITKPSIVVLKHDEYYEPIYEYVFKKDGKKTGGIGVRKVFSHNTVNENIKRMLLTIQHTSNRCRPQPSLPKVYQFKEPMPLSELIPEIYQQSLLPIAQIVNYRNKVIGVLVRFDNTEREIPTMESNTADVMIPCFPSAPSTEFKTPVEIRTVNDENVWNDYQTTRDVLTKIYQKSRGKIPCSPRVKVAEEDVVVGVLTMTNQFIQIMPPLKEDIDDEIPTEKMTNMNAADKEIATSETVDMARVEKMQRIRLEKQFYLAFRSVVRELLNDTARYTIRKSIMDSIESQTKLYKTKLASIENELRTLVSGRVVFVDIAYDVLKDMDEINDCTNGDVDNTPYCITKNKEIPQLAIPKTNLLSSPTQTGVSDNEDLYFMRMADELLRYPRVRLFMFEPEKYLNLIDVDYQIRSGEMLLSQTSLQGPLLTDLEPIGSMTYIQQTNYDTAKPAVHFSYANDVIPLDDQTKQTVADTFDSECVNPPINIIGNPETSLWKRSFPNTSKEIGFKPYVSCLYYMMTVILKQHTGETYTVIQIKEKLWEGYSRFIQKDSMNLLRFVDIMNIQGKKQLMEPVLKKRMSFDARIFSEEYYLSDLDIWVLADTLQLPIILFNPNGVKGFTLGHKLEWILCGGKKTDKFFFIRSAITADDIQKNNIGKYNLIQPAIELNNTRDFYAVIVKALRGEPEYAKNVWSLDEMLKRKEYVSKKASR
jgi:hypothetical protein